MLYGYYYGQGSDNEIGAMTNGSPLSKSGNILYHRYNMTVFHDLPYSLYLKLNISNFKFRSKSKLWG